ASVTDLQKALHKTNKKWYPARQRFTLPAPASGAKPVVLDAKKRLAEYSTGTTLDVVFKDLGPQIGFKTVFFWEYFGPLVLYSLFYFFPQVFYVDGANRKLKDVQTYALIYWTFHYTKRILETFFVHRFSHGTMPLQNLFRNCGYYWSFAAFVSFFVNHPMYTPVSETQMAIGFGIAIVNQLSNLYCHIILRNLRSGSSSGYQIPSGFLFNFITCANYTTEITAWLGFNIATQSVAGYLFMLAGAMQMAEWALAKHKRLVKPDSPLPAPSPYVEETDSYTERREPESRPASPVRAVRTGRRVPRPRPPPVPGTHVMTLRPSFVPLQIPLPPPPESSLLVVPDPESDLACGVSPTVTHLLTTVVTDPSFESTAASALVAKLVDFAAACRLDYATSPVAESESDCPPSAGGECALGTDVLKDRQEDL
ncbi:unnamed protein product, partial [Closterium sp. NIES-54]